jgi:hypothetical protein
MSEPFGKTNAFSQSEADLVRLPPADTGQIPERYQLSDLGQAAEKEYIDTSANKGPISS